MNAQSRPAMKNDKFRRALWRTFVNLSSAFYKLIRVGLFVIAVASVAAYFGEWLKVFDFASQLRVQYLFGASIGLALTLMKREWRWSVIALIGIALNVWPIARWYVPQERTVSTQQRLKLVQYNALFQNHRYQNLIEFLREEQPDIVTLQEITPDWVTGLAPLSAQFAYSRLEPQAEGKGVAVYSKLKLDKAEVVDLGGDQRPNLLVQFLWQNKMFSLITAHPPNPFGANRFDWRNQQLTRTAEYLQSLPSPKILVGDLNITMWSAYYQKLVTEAQLMNAREGYGLLPTWHAKIRFPFMMIPIDQCLVSRDLEVTAMRTGRPLGSDHLPLIIELAVK